MRVKNIRPGQAFAIYNESASADVQIEPGDRVISVNSVPGGSMTTNAQEGFSMMRAELQKSTSVEERVARLYVKNYLSVHSDDSSSDESSSDESSEYSDDDDDDR